MGLPVTGLIGSSGSCGLEPFLTTRICFIFKLSDLVVEFPEHVPWNLYFLDRDGSLVPERIRRTFEFLIGHESEVDGEFDLTHNLHESRRRDEDSFLVAIGARGFDVAGSRILKVQVGGSREGREVVVRVALITVGVHVTPP